MQKKHSEENHEDSIQQRPQIMQSLLCQTENPFSFYQQYRAQRTSSETDSDLPLEELNDVITQHKFDCFSFSAKSLNWPNSNNKTQQDSLLFISGGQIPLTKSVDNIHDNQDQYQQIRTQILNRQHYLINQNSDSILEKEVTSRFELQTLKCENQQDKHFKDIVNNQKIQNNRLNILIESGNQHKIDKISLKQRLSPKNNKKEFNKQLFIENDNKTLENIQICQITKNQEDEGYFQECRMLKKIVASKRQQNYKLLQDWIDNRADSLDSHQNLVEYFLNQIDKRLKQSLANFEIYATFFREKAKQQEKYLSQPILNTRTALKDNMVSKKLYEKCSIVLNTLSDHSAKKYQKILDFIHLIRQNVLKDLMQQHSSNSQRQLLRIRQKISTYKMNLEKYTEQVQKTYEELQKCFEQSQSSHGEFFCLQLKYLRRCNRQMNTQKQLGQLSIEYYDTALNQDIKRSNIIRQALITYSKGLKQTYNIDIERQQMEQLSKGQEEKLIRQLYSFQEIFSQEYQQLFKKIINKKQSLSLECFKNYLHNYKINKFDYRIGILKDFSVLFSQKDKKNENSCYVLITVDSYLHLFINQQKKQIYSDPNISIPIQSKGFQFYDNSIDTVHIIKKDQRKSRVISYFWDMKQQIGYQLKFTKRDNKQEFLDTIKKLIN